MIDHISKFIQSSNKIGFSVSFLAIVRHDTPNKWAMSLRAQSHHQLKGALAMEIAIILLVIAVVFVVKSIKVVPQQSAWVLERLGKYHGTLTAGPNIVVPFVDQVAYKHSLKEVPLDVPSQICITKDNTQLQVDGILYFQVTDPMRASYGSSNYIVAITQLAQTTLRSVVGKMELDKTFEERDLINAAVVTALDEAAMNWGVKVLRYEIKDLTPPAEILRSMQAQITAEREKRALIAASEGRRQEQINIATGEREAFIARSEGEKQAEINKALGEASAIEAVASATAEAIRKIAAAIEQPGGQQAVQLKVAEKAVDAYAELARTNNTMIVPGNMSEVSSLIGTAMTLLKPR
jgi:regulator of protease activity HflC (stomatin/prohibitin superfamily)